MQSYIYCGGREERVREWLYVLWGTYLRVVFCRTHQSSRCWLPPRLSQELPLLTLSFSLHAGQFLRIPSDHPTTTVSWNKKKAFYSPLPAIHHFHSSYPSALLFMLSALQHMNWTLGNPTDIIGNVVSNVRFRLTFLFTAFTLQSKTFIDSVKYFKTPTSFQFFAAEYANRKLLLVNSAFLIFKMLFYA